jgi:Flp pilus assembly protein TadG
MTSLPETIFSRSHAGVGQRRRRFLGNATIEFCVVGMILFWMTFGTIEYGYYFYVRGTLQAAARAGCRAAILSGATNTAVNNAVLAQLKLTGLLAGSATSVSPNYTVTTSPTDVSTAGAGNQVSVAITCTWGVVGANFRPLRLIGSAKVLTGACVLRAEANGTNYSP